VKPEILDYVRYRMDRADEALDVARLVLKLGHPQDAVNRLYYACFYAVSALLLLEGMQSSKHKGVRNLFDLHWIRPGRLPRQMGSFYRELMDARGAADYEDMVEFSRGDIESWLVEARGFVDEVKKRVEELIAGQPPSPAS
jgi:uncharacterized protein (UPF0332 family)